MDLGDRDPNRQSLANLTGEFIALLTANPGVEIDLSAAERMLSTAKRRLYDITNVLAGGGMIERCGRSRVKWIGRPLSSDHKKRARGDHAQRERELDIMLEFVDNALNELFASDAFEEHGWLSKEDIVSVDPDETVKLFALRGPPSMKIEVGDPDETEHHMICTAEDGRIEMIPVGGRMLPRCDNTFAFLKQCSLTQP
jgi:hypothetical protein